MKTEIRGLVVQVGREDLGAPCQVVFKVGGHEAATLLTVDVSEQDVRSWGCRLYEQVTITIATLDEPGGGR